MKIVLDFVLVSLEKLKQNLKTFESKLINLNLKNSQTQLIDRLCLRFCELVDLNLQLYACSELFAVVDKPLVVFE